MTTAKQEVEEIIKDVLRQKQVYMKSFLKISDKQRVVKPFRPWNIQQKIIDKLEVPGYRGVVVKPRQVGATSGITAFFTTDTITTPGTTSVIVAYEEFITERILNKTKFYYDNIPEKVEIKPGVIVRIKPEMSSDSKHEKTFPEINSTLYIGTARSSTFGRGDTIHNFLGDEYAFWPDVDKIMVPVLQAVPPSGRVVLTSTPNGEDNPFHDLYIEARDDENSAWSASFYPWYMHEEYRTPIGGGLPMDNVEALVNLTEQEFKLLEAGVDMDQLRWRRRKRDELEKLRRTQDAVFTFDQEYPEDDITCWLSAGNMVYDPDLLSDKAMMCYPAPKKWKGSWEVSYTDSDVLQVWEEPKEYTNYVIGLDPGMGRQTLTALSVWRFWVDDSEEDEATGRGVERGALVASLYGLIEPEDTAEIIKQVGRYYNGALLVPEANNHGLAVLTHLHSYGNIYLREQLESGRMTKTPGWLTSPKSKPVMVNALRGMMDYLEIPDIRMVSQFANIRRILNPNTQKWNYESVGPDDIHDSAALAMVGRPEIIAHRGFVGQAGYPDGWGDLNYDGWDD